MRCTATTHESRSGVITGHWEDCFEIAERHDRYISVANGWGVWFSLVYAGDDAPNPDEPVAFTCGIVEIRWETIKFVAGKACIQCWDNFYIPVENFGNDENDLAASRFFKTRDEAMEHLAYARRHLVQNGLCDEGGDIEGSDI